jgi:acetyltransferase-like isoleucine patch superfamily enzyme
MADIVFFGTGQSAEVARVYLEAYSQHRIVGFTVDAQYWKAETFYGLPVVPWERLEESFPPEQVELLGPISYARMNEFRRDRYLEGKARQYRFASFIHPDCHIYTQDIGEHCFILESNIVEPLARIGNNLVMWGGCHIGHHAVIGDDCFIAAGVVIGARARIDRRCFLGVRAVILPDVTVGEASMLGVAVSIQTHVAPGSVIASDARNRLARFPSSRLRLR